MTNDEWGQAGIAGPFVIRNSLIQKEEGGRFVGDNLCNPGP